MPPDPPLPVAPSILALYNHEGWQALHDALTVEIVVASLMDADFGLYMRVYHAERLLELIEQEIPYATMKRP
jgi:hypothetical protein